MATINLVGRKFGLRCYVPNKGVEICAVEVTGQADGETEDIVRIEYLEAHPDDGLYEKGYEQHIPISVFIKQAEYDIDFSA